MLLNKPDFPKNHPLPVGWRILVLPKPVEQRTSGGIILPDEAKDVTQYATQVCYVVAVGPDAYKDPSKFHTGPWCKEGDWVLVAKYAGSKFVFEATEFKIFNDDEIIAVVSTPKSVKPYKNA